jgi:deoxyribodipyrimidine photo-lyase
MYNNSIFWFRRDLRLEDNSGLFHALKRSKSVRAIFIFDQEILLKLNSKNDKRVNYIYQSIIKLKIELNENRSDIDVFFGNVVDVFSKLIKGNRIDAIFTNRDYEPYAIKRDKQIFDLLEKNGISFHHFKDQVVFEAGEIITKENRAYHVFTAYKNAWLKKITSFDLESYDNISLISRLANFSTELPSIDSLGFRETEVDISEFDAEKLRNYKEDRDYPFVSGTSGMSVALRFGTISIRSLSRWAYEHNPDYLSELIWREFFMMLLAYYPNSAYESFKEKYRKIEWKNDPELFEKWKIGETGVPIIDAGMRELNETGLMHNRVRMITASFLCKNLHIDWRLGERYFSEKLLDFELSSNVGNWQWVAGTGVDAAPYFRIFNPIRQQERFDPDFLYIKKWVQNLEDSSYPKPIVDIKESALETKKMFKNFN